MDLKLKDAEEHRNDPACNKDRLIGVVELPLNKRYAIPPKLVRTILNRMVERYKGVRGGNSPKNGAKSEPTDTLLASVLEKLKELGLDDEESEAESEASVYETNPSVPTLQRDRAMIRDWEEYEASLGDMFAITPFPVIDARERVANYEASVGGPPTR